MNSLLEPGTEEVAAFEGLVGCHGGLGGWQDRAFVVVPDEVPFPSTRVVGADALHVALVDILRHLGHRRDVPDERPDDEAASPREEDALREVSGHGATALGSRPRSEI